MSSDLGFYSLRGHLGSRQAASEAAALLVAGWSPLVNAERGEQDQDEGGDSQEAVEDHDRQREVPFRGDDGAPGQRRAGVTDGPVHAEPACRHDQAQDGDGAQGADSGPRQPLLIEQKVADPQHQAAQAEQGVSGNHRHGQASRGRGLEFAVVLDDPDNKENEASQNGDNPGKQGDDAHLNLISDALELSSSAQGARTGPEPASSPLRTAGCAVTR